MTIPETGTERSPFFSPGWPESDKSKRSSARLEGTRRCCDPSWPPRDPSDDQTAQADQACDRGEAPAPVGRGGQGGPRRDRPGQVLGDVVERGEMFGDVGDRDGRLAGTEPVGECELLPVGLHVALIVEGGRVALIVLVLPGDTAGQPEGRTR